MRWLNALHRTRNGEYGVTVTKDTPATLAAPVSAFKPRVDRSEMSVTAVLTSRTPDRQGDIVNPAGGDFSEHVTNPVVMFHHGKQHKLPIGKAEDRDGNYTVRLVKARDGDVLLGTTHFAQSSRFAQDVFGLVAEDVLRGVSIGFDPPEDQTQVEQLGDSPVLDRPALHFKAWKLLEYSHTPIGVNRDALTVAVEKALDGSRKLHPALLKALQPMAQKSSRTIVPVRLPPAPAHTKGVEDDEDDTAPGDDGDNDASTMAGSDDGDDAPIGDDLGDNAGDDAGAGTQGFDPAVDDPSSDPAMAKSGASYATPDDMDEPPPTVQALTDGAQGILDLCSMIEQAMKKSEHMKGRQFAAKLCDDLRSTAAEVQGFADKVHGELAGGLPSDSADGDATEADNAAVPPGDDGDDAIPKEPTSDPADETAEAEDAPADGGGDEDDDDQYAAKSLTLDHTGRIVTKGGYAPRRLTFADLGRPAPAAKANKGGADPREAKALERRLASAERDNEELRATLDGLLSDLEASDRVRNR